MSLRNISRDKVYTDSRKCIRCGYCIYACPSWIAHGRREPYSPRARSILAGLLLENQGDVDLLLTSLDTIYSCNTCKRCYLECPTGVNVGDMIIYARHMLLNALAEKGKI